jgi:hypothetical protein
LVFSPELLKPSTWRKIARRTRRLPVTPLAPRKQFRDDLLGRLLRLAMSLDSGSEQADQALQALFFRRISSSDNPMWWKARFSRFLSDFSKPALIAAILRLMAKS